MARVAIVTGGTRGIGRAIAVALHQAGYKVAANYAGNAKAAAKFTTETGIASFRFDVADFKSCEAGVKQIEAKLGGPARDPGQQRRHHPRRGAASHDARAMERGHRHQPDLVLQHVPARHRRHARARLRPHRQHRLDQRPGRAIRPGQLRRRQIGHPRLHQGAGAGRRGQGRHRQRHRARLHRHRHGARRARRTCWRRSSRAFRSAGSATPRRSRAACCSWSPTRPASSPARRCRSMAGSTCTKLRTTPMRLGFAHRLCYAGPLTLEAAPWRPSTGAWRSRRTISPGRNGGRASPRWGSGNRDSPARSRR